MNAEKPFSVIIPTCHRNDLLALCLARLSPGAQSLPFDQYEVIVSDDGRRTTAEQMLRQDYPWAKWVAGAGKGPAANRNNGARLAQGQWLIFTDDDCLPESGWLAAFAAGVTADTAVYEGKTTCHRGLHSPLEHAPINLTGGYLWSCNLMIRKKIFQAVHGFDEGFPFAHLEDCDLRDRLRDAGFGFRFIPDAAVDHPPRRVPSGRRWALTHESFAYYMRIKQGKKEWMGPLLKNILIHRLRQILAYRLSRDSIVALGSLLMEMFVVLKNLSAWDRKYSISAPAPSRSRSPGK
jgi:GT2 family glycosyltransferase